MFLFFNSLRNTKKKTTSIFIVKFSPTECIEVQQKNVIKSKINYCLMYKLYMYNKTLKLCSISFVSQHVWLTMPI